MSDTRRALLRALADGPVAGPALAERLGVSRAAVWKQVDALRDDGFVVDSGPDGYAVAAVPEYNAPAVEFGLDAPYAVEYHDALGSTNDRARSLAAEGVADAVVVADEQTGGRGRLSREWSAPSGGVWLSLVLRPDCPPARAPLYTLAAAVATADACREAGADAAIKWPNDVLVGGAGGGGSGSGEENENRNKTGGDAGTRGERKLAGILTEMEGEADRVSWLVVGAGVNANVDVDALPEGATSLRAELGGDVDRRRFVQRLLEAFHDLAGDPDRILPAWRERASTLGRRVRVDTPGGPVEGAAVDVRSPGALVVDTDEGEVVVHAGDCEHLRPA